MQLILTFLSDLFARGFTFLVARIGLMATLNVSFFAVWYLLIASLTAVSYSCFSVGGSCSTFTDFTGLSEWVKFGMSLVPVEALQILACLLSLHAAGWAYTVLLHILKSKRNIAQVAAGFR